MTFPDDDVSALLQYSGLFREHGIADVYKITNERELDFTRRVQGRHDRKPDRLMNHFVESRAWMGHEIGRFWRRAKTTNGTAETKAATVYAAPKSSCTTLAMTVATM